MFGFAYGQNYPVSHISFEQNNYNSVTKTIIRSYNGYVVSYIEDRGQHFFTITTIQDTQNPTNNMFIKKAEIDPQYSVTDFKIIDNYIYCCGIFTNNHAFVGYASIENLLVHNSFDFNVHADFNNPRVQDHYVSTLSKLEVFKTETDYRIITIGRTLNHKNENKACLMEIITTTLGNNNIAYKIGESPIEQETITGLAITDKYIVTVGSLYDNTCTAIRKFYKNKIFNDSTNITNVYTYPTNEDYIPSLIGEKADNILATTIISDTIGTASYWYHAPAANLGTDLQGVLLRIYDIIPSPPTMITSISINHNVCTGNWKINDFQYNSIIKAFTLLQYTNISQYSLGSLF